MNDLLSIIVPVYNNAKYLSQTLKSIQAQTYRTFELILVNDGSTDNSLEICRNAAGMDNRIIVIDKKNGGVSSARNRGLKIAKGKYISFVDGDDCIDSDMYRVMIDTLEAESADLVNCCVIKEENYKPISYKKEQSYVSTAPLNCLAKKGHFVDSSLNKVYTREIIGETCFDENISYSEDKLFVTEIFLKAKKVVFLDNIFYHYIQHKDSLSWQDNYDVWYGNFQVCKQIYTHIKSIESMDSEIKRGAFRGYVKSIIALLRYDIKNRDKDRYNSTLDAYKQDIDLFLQITPLPIAKRLEYKTYTISYFIASLVHYYFKRKK
ncbi:MAG: glycosyltransferase family 2 protein [Mitsuokella sp.]|uniref:glycosyltransferase family 2 protein n=1 Tax=Mitsuokella sp. TaxID=2049034 RepID=UPI003F12400A